MIPFASLGKDFDMQPWTRYIEINLRVLLACGPTWMHVLQEITVTYSDSLARVAPCWNFPTENDFGRRGPNSTPEKLSRMNPALETHIAKKKRAS